VRAIAATLALGTVAVEPERAEDGSVHVWLDPRVLAKLKALRGPGRKLQRRHHEAGEGRRRGDDREGRQASSRRHRAA
jgi:hypothetical protein